MSAFQSLLKRFWPQKQSQKIFVGGLDYAGKTTIVYKLLLDEVVTTISTIGINIETVNVPRPSTRVVRSTPANSSHNVTLWDIGSCGQINALRRLYLSHSEPVDAVLWVVDAADRTRIQDVIDDLKTFLKDSGNLVVNKPFMV